MLPTRRHLRRSDDGVIVTTRHKLTNVYYDYYLSSIRIRIRMMEEEDNNDDDEEEEPTNDNT